MEFATLRIAGLGEFPCSVAGSVATLPVIPASTTAKWQPGVYKWDIRASILTIVNVWIRGTIEVLEAE